jgi:hypothetical protein
MNERVCVRWMDFDKRSMDASLQKKIHGYHSGPHFSQLIKRN